MEIQASMFGSTLPMPIPVVKRRLYQVRFDQDNQATIQTMSEVFQVSRQAIRIRLTSHHLL